MDALINRLEAMGRRGGVIALGLAVAALPFAALLVWATLETSGWTSMAVGFPAAILGALVPVLAFIGIKLLTQTHYPSAGEVFPPMATDDFKAAVLIRDGPVCACTRCRVVLSAVFSTGSCPVCTSSVDYYEVQTDDDADMVLLALS